MPERIPIEALIKCVAREVALRRRVYPRQIEQGRIKPETAKYEIEAMEQVQAILETLVDKPLTPQ